MERGVTLLVPCEFVVVLEAGIRYRLLIGTSAGLYLWFTAAVVL